MVPHWIERFCESSGPLLMLARCAQCRYLRRAAAVETSFCKQWQELLLVDQQQVGGYRTKQARNSRLCPSTSKRGTPVMGYSTAFRNDSATSAER